VYGSPLRDIRSCYAYSAIRLIAGRLGFCTRGLANGRADKNKDLACIRRCASVAVAFAVFIYRFEPSQTLVHGPILRSGNRCKAQLEIPALSQPLLRPRLPRTPFSRKPRISRPFVPPRLSRLLLRCRDRFRAQRRLAKLKSMFVTTTKLRRLARAIVLFCVKKTSMFRQSPRNSGFGCIRSPGQLVRHSYRLFDCSPAIDANRVCGNEYPINNLHPSRFRLQGPSRRGENLL
jgi:hypothetical protein